MSSFQARSNARRKAQLSGYAHRMRHQATHSEQLLWAAIRGRALGVQFRRQVPVGGMFISDFVASEVKLIVEVDGGWHGDRAGADARRDAKLLRLGFVVLRLPAELVERQLSLALDRIRGAIATLSAVPVD